MTSIRSRSRGALIALTMMGVGLVTTGIIALLLINDQPASGASFEFSAVPAEVNFSAPDLRLVTLEGMPATLNEYTGRVVLVNLWATWCPPCRAEMPTLQAFYEKHQEDGFVLLAINQEETHDVVEPFVQELGLTFPIWLDINYLAQQKFNAAGLPSSYVIDRSGRVRLMWIGGISRRNLDKYVTGLILGN